MKEVFVETKRYHKAREVFCENHYEIITGSSGEGKTFIAMKLIYEKIQEGYAFKDIKSSEDFHDFEFCEKMVFLLDDVFQIDNHDTQFLILEIENFIEYQVLNDQNKYIVMTSRTLPLSVVKAKMKESWLLNDSCIVDLGNKKLQLTKEEKCDIIKNHLNKFKPEETKEKMKVNTLAAEIADVECTGFANYAYLFVRNKIWFKKGVDFFKHSNEIINKEVENLLESDPKVYLFLIYLLLKGGRITGSTLDDCYKDDNVIKLLEKIKTYPRKEYCSVLNSALACVDYAYVSRVNSSGTITFRHDRIIEAVCLSFSKILPHEAIMNVPFQFISMRMRTEEYKTDIQDMIIITADRYDDLARRFMKELQIGNIKGICEHPFTNNIQLVNRSVEKLQCSDQLSYLVQITERAFGSTLDGSLLYWSASCGAEDLCRRILDSGIYLRIKDKFWVRTQASAALVPSCWFGFSLNIIDKLLELGADINSSVHSERSFQTYTSDCLAVHDHKGWTPIQAAVCGTNENKAQYVLDMLDRNCKFQEKEMMQRPLIHAVKQGNKKLVRVLLQNGVNVQAVDMRKLSALHFAVEFDQIEITELLLDELTQPLEFVRPKSMEMMNLLKHYIDLEKKDTDERSLLHFVEDPKLVEFLVESNLSINICDHYERTPLYYASNEKVVQCMLAHGAMVTCVDSCTQDTILHVQKNLNIVLSILKRLKHEEILEIINAKNSSGITPIFKVNPEIFRCLLEYGADVNIRCSYKTPRPVSEEDICNRSCTVQNEKGEYVRKYINLEKTSNTSDDTSSLVCNHTETLDYQDGWKTTPDNAETYLSKEFTVVMKLASEGRLSLYLLDLCLKHGYDIDAMDVSGRTIIHHILYTERRLKDVPKLLDTVLKHAKHNMDVQIFVNHSDIFGNTALHLACCCCSMNKLKTDRKDVIGILLDYGADPNIVNKNTEKPEHKLMKCRCCGKLAILKQLNNAKKNTSLTSYLDSGIKLLVNLFKANPSCRGRPDDNLTDSINTIEYLLKEYQQVSVFSILKNFIELGTDPNLIMFILMKHLDILDNDEENKICNLCIRRTNVNSGITLLLMQHYLTKTEKIQFTKNGVSKLFHFCVEVFKEEVALTTVLNNLFQQDVVMNIEVNEWDKMVSWTLKRASVCHRSTVLDFLCKKGAKLNSELSVRDCIHSDGDDTLVMECLEILRKHGATFSKGSPLIWAIEANITRPKVIKFIINDKSTDLLQMDENKHNAFHCFLKQFASTNQTGIVLPLFRVLLQKMTFSDGNTPLRLALLCPNISKFFIIDILQHMGDINSVDSLGLTPLHNVLCYYEGNAELEIIQQIFKLGGKTSLNKKGQNCLQLLVSRMKYDTVKILLYLLETRRDETEQAITESDNDGNSVLHLTCSVNEENPKNDLPWCASLRISVARILLANGTNIDAVNHKKESALHILIRSYIFCVNKGSSLLHLIHPIIEIINLIVENGIDQNIRNFEGKTALQYLNGDKNEMNLLKKMMSGAVKPEELLLTEVFNGQTETKQT